MNFYITSDQHFLHENIIKYTGRPFTIDIDGVIECISLIGKNYNSVVKDEDLVFHLGDIACGVGKTYRKVSHILENLRGRKVLIKGNHDKWDDEYFLEHFESVQKYLIFGDYFFCHYPCYNSPEVQLGKKEKRLLEVLKGTDCTTVYHGHIHEKDPTLWSPDGYSRRNFSVDYTPNDYTPQKITDPNLINLLLELYK